MLGSQAIENIWVLGMVGGRAFLYTLLFGFHACCVSWNSTSWGAGDRKTE